MLWQKTFLFITLLSFSLTATAEINLVEALDDAGMQRTLTQKIAKDYLLECIYDNGRQYIREQEQSEALFETKLKKLKTFAEERGDATLEALLIQIESFWTGYRQIVDKKNDYNNAKTVIQASNNLLHICNQVVAHIEEIGISADALRYLELEDGEKLSYLNMAGRQRTRSQRIAMYLAADRLEMRDLDIKAELTKEILAFEDAMRNIYAASHNSAKIDELIGTAIDQWSRIKENILDSEESTIKKKDFESFDELMQKMDDITYRYEQALDHASVSQK